MKQLFDFLKWMLDHESNPWIFIGVVILISVSTDGISDIIKAIFWGQ